jgi:hypothetical protein
LRGSLLGFSVRRPTPAHDGGTPTAFELVMLAPRPATRLPIALPVVVDLVVGSMLEVVVQSVEGLRDQVRRLR